MLTLINILVVVLLLITIIALCRISYLQGYRDCAREPRLRLLNPNLTPHEHNPTPGRARTGPTP